MTWGAIGQLHSISINVLVRPVVIANTLQWFRLQYR